MRIGWYSAYVTSHPIHLAPFPHPAHTPFHTLHTQVTMFDRVRTGWYSVHVTSHPDKIYDALNASVAVLRDIAVNPINRRELAR